MRRFVLTAVFVLIPGCATKAVIEETVVEIGRTAAQANAGIAAVSTQAQVLLGTLDGEIAASGSETRALMEETRALMAETRSLVATVRSEVATNGQATTRLAGSLSDLAVTVREGISANSSATRATTAAIASTTGELDALIAGVRPNLVAASAELTPTLANVREATASIKDRADDPLISGESRWLLRVVLAAVAALLLHAVWTHLHLKKVAGAIIGVGGPEATPQPPS